MVVLAAMMRARLCAAATRPPRAGHRRAPCESAAAVPQNVGRVRVAYKWQVAFVYKGIWLKR